MSSQPPASDLTKPRDLLEVFARLTPDELTARARSLGLPDDALDYSVVYRLIEKIQPPDDPADPDACWLWLSVQQGAGYGRIKIAHRYVGAHRVICALVHGPIPPGFDAAHECDRPWCTRPSHLHAASRAANMAEAKERQRLQGRAVSRTQRTRHIPEIAYRRLARNGGDLFEAYSWVGAIFGITPGYVGTLLDHARRAAFDAAFPSAEASHVE